MKKVYLDKTTVTAPLGVWMKDTEIINAGTTIYSMPVKYKNSEYQRYADEYDIRFIFDDAIPVLDFYTIPQIDVFAIDSNGGYIGSLEGPADLNSKASICYIDDKHKCFIIADNFKEFLQNATHWKTKMIPYADVEFFDSKEDAENKYEFLNIEDIPKRKQNMLQGAKILDIISWLPDEQISLEELEQIFLNHKMGIKNDEYIVSMELPKNVDVNISDGWKQLNADGKIVACISKGNDVVALISYQE